MIIETVMRKVSSVELKLIIALLNKEQYDYKLVDKNTIVILGILDEEIYLELTG